MRSQVGHRQVTVIISPPLPQSLFQYLCSILISVVSYIMVVESIVLYQEFLFWIGFISILEVLLGSYRFLEVIIGLILLL